MQSEELGYNHDIEQYRQENNLDGFEVGRVISEHKERYIIKTPEGEYEGEIIGNLRFSASQRSDFPAVGDWVAFMIFDEDKALIHHIFPRKTILERQAVGKHGELAEETYENYLKMEREKAYFESTVAERRKRDKKFGKMVKNIMKNQKYKN